jgi:hypothetical protein
LPEDVDGSPKTWKGRVEALMDSRLMLGALIAVLTVASAWVAYRSTSAALDSSTQDFYAAKEMQRASLLGLDGNAGYMIDLVAYNRYNELKERAPDLAEEVLNRGSPELLAGMDRPGGPFDEVYESARYGEARAALDRAQALYDQADRASLEAERFALGTAILSIGLGATAWAALLHKHSLLRLVFALLAVASVVAALALAFLLPSP